MNDLKNIIGPYSIEKEDRLRAYLEKHNKDVHSPKTFSFSGIEKKLDLPAKTFDNFINYRYSIMSHWDKISTFFVKTLSDGII